MHRNTTSYAVINIIHKNMNTFNFINEILIISYKSILLVLIAHIIWIITIQEWIIKYKIKNNIPIIDTNAVVRLNAIKKMYCESIKEK